MEISVIKLHLRQVLLKRNLSATRKICFFERKGEVFRGGGSRAPPPLDAKEQVRSGCILQGGGVNEDETDFPNGPACIFIKIVVNIYKAISMCSTSAGGEKIRLATMWKCNNKCLQGRMRKLPHAGGENLTREH